MLLRIVAYSVSCLPSLLFQILCNTHTHTFTLLLTEIYCHEHHKLIILYWKSHITDLNYYFFCIFLSVFLVSAFHCWATYLRHIWRLSCTQASEWSVVSRLREGIDLMCEKICSQRYMDPNTESITHATFCRLSSFTGRLSQQWIMEAPWFLCLHVHCAALWILMTKGRLPWARTAAFQSPRSLYTETQTDPSCSPQSSLASSKNILHENRTENSDFSTPL